MTVLRHGPLTADMVPLLTAGSSVLLIDYFGSDWNGIAEYIDTDGNTVGVRHPIMGTGNFPPSHLTYIGERGPDGWTTTPDSGWAENPVPGMRVEVRGDAFVCTDFPSELFNWNQTAIAACVTAFRPTEALSAHPPATGSPVPVTIFCPECAVPHLDEGEWATRPHKTHQCQSCGHEWRPFPFATVGVEHPRPATGEAVALHPRTVDLVDRFAAALKEKLAKAEEWLEAVAAWEAAGRPRTLTEKEA